MTRTQATDKKDKAMETATRTKDQLSAAIAGYVAGSQDIINRYFATHYETTEPCRLTPPVLEARSGKRYVKIVRIEYEGSLGSVHSFIDTTNGNILKPASWKAPAKHARGNVFDENFGLATASPWGPAYLR